jgi:hypothetical protein
MLRAPQRLEAGVAGEVLLVDDLAIVGSGRRAAPSQRMQQ